MAKQKRQFSQAPTLQAKEVLKKNFNELCPYFYAKQGKQVSPSKELLATTKMKFTTITSQRKLTLQQPNPVGLFWSWISQSIAISTTTAHQKAMEQQIRIDNRLQMVSSPMCIPMAHHNHTRANKLAVGPGQGRIGVGSDREQARQWAVWTGIISAHQDSIPFLALFYFLTVSQHYLSKIAGVDPLMIRQPFGR